MGRKGSLWGVCIGLLRVGICRILLVSLLRANRGLEMRGILLRSRIDESGVLVRLILLARAASILRAKVGHIAA